MSIRFGFQEQWDAFHRRNAVFFERWENLHRSIQLAFNNGQTLCGPQDRVVYLLGRLCCEDFYELLLLAANGYGFGAQKILRGMYERAVTMTYLSEHEEEVDAFMGFHFVAQRKLASAIKRVYGPNMLPKHIDAAVEEQYNRVKENYRVTDCAKCETTRINFTWSKLDFVSMAHKTGNIGNLIVTGYYVPMSHAHSTVQSMMSRTEVTPTGLGFNPDAQPDEADSALHTAHNILLRVVELQWKRFNMGDELWEQRTICHKDFMDIWGKQTAEGAD